LGIVAAADKLLDANRVRSAVVPKRSEHTSNAHVQALALQLILELNQKYLVGAVINHLLKALPH